MKRYIFGLAAGGALLAAAIGSAASLGGVTGSVGASSNVVASCDTDGVTTSYNWAYDPNTNQIFPNQVYVNGIDANCAGKTLTVILTDGNTFNYGSVANITTPSQAVSISDLGPSNTAIPLANVNGISVMIS